MLTPIHFPLPCLRCDTHPLPPAMNSMLTPTPCHTSMLTPIPCSLPCLSTDTHPLFPAMPQY
ncbi:hypothetical protein E2C01_054779 [Portunus trituberculatus]|uniref:Uncharacterized protein n=1 Tax=Portunus trituberculatus TaxID=210409 RepID=A0A5B7GSY9_PORTR|nr:hypothetical protein [Portunus trituberculatus]